MNKISFYGASGHGKVLIEIAESTGISIGHIFDDNPAIQELLGFPISSNFDEEIFREFPLIISIGQNQIRKKVAGKIKGPFAAPLVHPSAVVSSRARLGQGTTVMANACINSDARIGQHCIINTQSTVEHDCELGDFVHISPSAALGGNVQVGEGTHIGIGASVIQGIRIGKWCTIGAGAVVTVDIPDHCTAVGIPAKPIKFHES